MRRFQTDCDLFRARRFVEVLPDWVGTELTAGALPTFGMNTLVPCLFPQRQPERAKDFCNVVEMRVLSGRGQQTWVYGAVWSKGFRPWPVSLLEELIQSIVGDVFEGRIPDTISRRSTTATD